MLVALHEAAAERSPCKIQSLEDPDPSHQNHQDTDKAAYHSHYRAEHTTHRSPHLSHRQEISESILFSLSYFGTADNTPKTHEAHAPSMRSRGMIAAYGRPVPRPRRNGNHSHG